MLCKSKNSKVIPIDVMQPKWKDELKSLLSKYITK